MKDLSARISSSFAAHGLIYYMLALAVLGTELVLHNTTIVYYWTDVLFSLFFIVYFSALVLVERYIQAIHPERKDSKFWMRLYEFIVLLNLCEIIKGFIDYI